MLHYHVTRREIYHKEAIITHEKSKVQPKKVTHQLLFQYIYTYIVKKILLILLV